MCKGMNLEWIYGNTRMELRSLCFWRDCCVEIVATFILLTVQCSVVLSWDDTAPPTMYGTTLVHQGLVMGFIVCSTSWAFGDFGGCIMNPAVTIGMVVCRKISPFRGAIYIIAQCFGAVAGSGFMAIVTPAHRRGNLSATNLSPEIHVWQGVLVEAWLTFVLVCVVHGATNSERKGKVYMPTIIIGFFVAVAVMTGSAQTGASMNPARSFGPAVIMNKWQNHWVYWVGPISGSVLGTGVYYLVNSVKDRSVDNVKQHLSIVSELDTSCMNKLSQDMQISNIEDGVSHSLDSQIHMAAIVSPQAATAVEEDNNSTLIHVEQPGVTTMQNLTPLPEHSMNNINSYSELRKGSQDCLDCQISGVSNRECSHLNGIQQPTNTSTKLFNTSFKDIQDTIGTTERETRHPTWHYNSICRYFDNSNLGIENAQCKSIDRHPNTMHMKCAPLCDSCCVSRSTSSLEECSVVLSWDDTAPPTMYGTTLVHQGLVMGFIVCSTSWAFGDFGGCIMNPAVTIGMVVCRKISPFRGAIYIIAQCFGAVAGSGFMAIVTPAHRRGNLSATNLSPEIHVWQGVLVEAWLTFVLVCVVHGATNSERKGKVYMPTIIIGFFVAVAVMTGSAQTGASMNPARSFGPAVIMNKWQNHWVYWVGPISGSVLGTGVYYLVNSVKDRSVDNVKQCLSIVSELDTSCMNKLSQDMQISSMEDGVSHSLDSQIQESSAMSSLHMAATVSPQAATAAEEDNNSTLIHVEQPGVTTIQNLTPLPKHTMNNINSYSELRKGSQDCLDCQISGVSNRECSHLNGIQQPTNTSTKLFNTSFKDIQDTMGLTERETRHPTWHYNSICRYFDHSNLGIQNAQCKSIDRHPNTMHMKCAPLCDSCCVSRSTSSLEEVTRRM